MRPFKFAAFTVTGSQTGASDGEVVKVLFGRYKTPILTNPSDCAQPARQGDR